MLEVSGPPVADRGRSVCFDKRLLAEASMRGAGPAMGDSVAHLLRKTTFAGVGLQANLGELRKQGLRPLAVSAIGAYATAAITLDLLPGASSGSGLL